VAKLEKIGSEGQLANWTKKRNIFFAKKKKSFDPSFSSEEEKIKNS
jgi:hypothetical protein